MTLDFNVGVPSRLVSGDSLNFRLCLDGFKAGDGWVCVVHLVGGQRLDITGTADGDDFLFSATPAQTSQLTAGRFVYHVRVSMGGEVKTVLSGSLQIKNSLSTLDAITQASVDPATMVRKLDKAIEEALETGFASFSIGGQSANNYSLTELYALREKYASKVRQKRVRERGKRTGTFGKSVGVKIL